MSSTYTWPQVVNGKSYSEADFRPYSYATTLPDLLGNFAAQATNAQGAVKAAEAATSAAAAATSAAQAAGRVAGVTTGSTSNLVYPEAVANLVTAADVRDVLVYDTRLDSDGGAWVRRCQHTSWWNETLNTATRGAKRDFPTVALIVLRTSGMTIYDLHDLDGSGVPRMWMVFNAGSANHLFTAGGSLLTALAASNGYIMATSTGGSGSGRAMLYAFPGDATIGYSTFFTFRYSKPLVGRNAGDDVTQISAAILPSNDIADVAMRVLPGALRDGAGLPIPTIALATSGGLSVIHSSGQIVNLTGTGYSVVSFISDTHLWGNFESDRGANVIYQIPYASGGESGVRVAAYYITPNTPAGLAFNVASTTTMTETALAGINGLAQFAHELTNPANGMVAITRHDHATGWQPGDIRLAALCDNRTGAWASDIRLSLDGTSTAGFTQIQSAAITSTGGRIRVARNGIDNPAALMVFTGLTVGETYAVDFDAYTGTAGTWILRVTNGATVLLDLIGAADSVGRRAQFVANDTSANLIVYAITSTGTQYCEFDNITIRAGVADRSWRASGLHVVGSLSRAAVGTGNDVVALSGWGASNYLQQPYNADLDFGTGDFSFSFWFSYGAGGGVFISRGNSGYTNAGLSIFSAGSFTTQMAITDGTNSASVTTTSGTAGSFRHYVFVKRGTTLEVWVDGVREATASAASVGSLNNSSAILRLGQKSDGAAPASSTDRLAMLRISAYAPTPTQIARMWRDERALFDTGAKALLGGTTSAVQALSYSEHSQRLAVATTDGVGVFAGLRRVEYLSTSNLSPAMASNNASKIALEAGALVVGTAANAGMRRDAITGLDRMEAVPRAPFSPRRHTARGFTTDATPLTLAPRLGIGERETLIVLATVVGRVFGAADGQRLSYQRRATYYRDAGGNVTLQGSVQTIGTDTEVTSTADATLVIDTTAQTVAPQVTGVAATRIVWTATFEVTRIADAQYEEIV